MLDCAVLSVNISLWCSCKCKCPVWWSFLVTLNKKPCIYFLLHRIKFIDGEVVLLPPSASSHACKQTGSLRDESPSSSDVTMVQWRHQPCCSHGNHSEASECRKLHINTHPRTSVTTCVEILRLVATSVRKLIWLLLSAGSFTLDSDGENSEKLSFDLMTHTLNTHSFISLLRTVFQF